MLLHKQAGFTTPSNSRAIAHPRLQDQLPGGLPVGSITLVHGARSSGKTSFALEPLAPLTQAGRQAAVIDTTHAINPVALHNLGIVLRHILFLRVPSSSKRPHKHTLWAIQQVVVSQVFDVVLVVEPGPLSQASMRQLQLAAERSETVLLFLNSTPLPHRNAIHYTIHYEVNPTVHSDDISPILAPPRRASIQIQSRGHHSTKRHRIAEAGA